MAVRLCRIMNSSLLMHRFVRGALDLSLPEGYSVRTFNGVEDIDCWLELQKGVAHERPLDSELFTETFGSDFGVLSSSLLFLEYRGEVVGSVAISRGGNGFPDGAFRLEELIVAPHFRRKGCGRILVKAVLDKAVGLGSTEVYLSTTSVRSEALPLFISEGFLPYFATLDDCRLWGDFLREEYQCDFVDLVVKHQL